MYKGISGPLQTHRIPNTFFHNEPVLLYNLIVEWQFGWLITMLESQTDSVLKDFSFSLIGSRNRNNFISRDTTMLTQKRQLILTKQGGCSYNHLRWHFPAYVQTQLSWSFSHPAAWKLRTSLLPTMNGRRKTSITLEAGKTTWRPHSHAELNQGCWLRSPSRTISFSISAGLWTHSRALLTRSPRPCNEAVIPRFYRLCRLRSLRELQGITSKGKMKEPLLFTEENKWSWVQSKCKCRELNLCQYPSWLLKLLIDSLSL